jgi:hypothetical protein
MSIVLAIGLTAIAIGAVAFLPPLHPAQLWSIPWAIMSVLYATDLLPYVELSWLTFAIVLGANLTFVLLTLVGSQALGVRPGPALPLVPDRRIQPAAGAALILTAAWLAAFLVQAVAGYGIDALVAPTDLRVAIGEGEFTFTVKYIYAALAASALAGAAAGVARSTRERRLWMLGAAGCCGSMYFSTGRSSIVFAAVAALVAFFGFRPAELTRSRFLQGGAGVMALALITFLIGGSVLGKTFSNDETLKRLPSVFSEHDRFAWLALPYEYASAPLPAFEVRMRETPTIGGAGGCATIPELCQALSRAGVDTPAFDRRRSYTGPPLRWNVFTALDAPLIDWGKVPVIPIMGLLGFGTGVLWAASRRGSSPARLMYALLAIVLLTGYSTFYFTAPNIVGGVLIALALVWFAGAIERRGRSAMSDTTTARVSSESAGGPLT